VLAAIDFDDQSRFVADKVGNEVPGRHPKAESIPFGLARSQHLPELFLRFGHLTAERPGAVMGAVVDALRPLGIVHLDMRTTPEKVWRAIRAAPSGVSGAP
jgi:hypothetical protein